MGLDAVVLVMAFEEGFGVSISDAEAEACVTPAMVIDVVFSKLKATDAKVCVSQRAFYLLRRAVMETLTVSRSVLSLDADLRSLVEQKKHPQFWNEVKGRLKVRSWPPLARPTWITATLATASILLFLGLLPLVHWGLAVGAGGFFAVTAQRSSEHLRRQIPHNRCSMRRLVPYAVTSDYIAWTREQVALLVRKIIIEQLGLREGQYREDAHFVKDLGIG